MRDRSFLYFEATCPKVEEIFNDLVDGICKEDLNERTDDYIKNLIYKAEARIKNEVTIPFREAFSEFVKENEK